ncbi:SWIM zinc finger family protein, partial [Amycolatopsis japonica]
MPGATGRKRRTFGNTWWGKAWVEALEERAKLDPNRLPRGRTYARKGTVSKLAVGAGEVTAWVQGSRAVPYRVTIHMRAFTEPQWESLLGMVGSRLGHVAALLDGELPAELAEDARSAGADLLPGPGDLRPKCSCPDSANPCKHVAAVYYLVADEVDADPFVLFLLRGRPREAVLAELRADELGADGAVQRAERQGDVEAVAGAEDAAEG